MRNILLLLQIILVIKKISFGNTNPSDEEVQSKKRSRNTWTPDMIDQIAEIYRSIDFNDPHRFRKIKNEWYNLNPVTNISEEALRHKYRKLTQKMGYKGKRPQPDVKWCPETSDDLLDAYLNTRPYNKSNPVALNDEWKRRHPDFPKASNSYLSYRARSWMKKQKLNVEGGSSKRLFEWTPKQDSDLLHVYYVTVPEGQKRPISMHRIFTDLHPKLRELTADQIVERIEYLRRNPPDKHFPWTQAQNTELLKLFHSTSPETADQGQRIYDIWTKIHPHYSFMTPYYLQVHASTLAYHASANCTEKKTAVLSSAQEANLVDMYNQLAKPKRSLYDFHNAWVREYPSLAYVLPEVIARRAKRIASRDNPSHVDVIEGDPQISRIESRKQHIYSPDDRAKLLAIYQQTDPHTRGHSERIYKKWTENNQHVEDIQPKSLIRTIRRWMRDDTRKKGKELMVTPKTELEAESSRSTCGTPQLI